MWYFQGMRKLPIVLVVLSVLLVCAQAASASPTSTAKPLASGVSTTTGGGTTLSMGTFAGAEYGVAKELVYYSDPSFNYYKVSELDWPLEPMILAGAKFSLETPFGLTSALRVSSGIPSNVGKITDSDFLNFDGQKTHFSEHTATLEHSMSARLDVGWRTRMNSAFSVAAFGRYIYRTVKWTAHDGYLQYPPSGQSSPNYTTWSPSTPKIYLYGLVALYQQIYSIPAVGVRGEYTINDRLSLSGSFAFSPFASVNDIDNHVLRNLIFYDSTSGATYLEPNVSLVFSPSSSFALTLDVSYLSVVSPKNGIVSVEDTTTGLTTSMAGSGSTAGITLQTYNATLGVRLAF